MSPFHPALLKHFDETLPGFLNVLKAREKVPAFLLLIGPAGCGKRTLAHYAAQGLLCERGFACGSCPSCQRAIHGTWTDFREIGGGADDEKEEGSASPSLKLEDFSEIRRTQGFAAEDGRFKIFLVSRAERMTPQAANSLLKVLEEPPRGWIFILTTADVSLLLPTLISRSFQVRLKPLAQPLIEKILLDGKEAPRPEQAHAASVASTGNLRLALELYDGRYKDPLEWLCGLWRSGSEAIACAQKLLDWASEDQARYRFVLDRIEEAIGARWMNTVTSAAPLSAEQQSRHLPLLDRISELRKTAKAPLNKKIQLQSLLAQFF